MIRSRNVWLSSWLILFVGEVALAADRQSTQSLSAVQDSYIEEMFWAAPTLRMDAALGIRKKSGSSGKAAGRSRDRQTLRWPSVGNSSDFDEGIGLHTLRLDESLKVKDKPDDSQKPAALKAGRQAAEWLPTIQSSYIREMAGGVQALRIKASLGVERKLGNSSKFVALVSAEFDGEDNIEPGIPGQAAISSSSRRHFFNNHAASQLHEFYVDGSATGWDFRFGKQQIVWGKSDGIKVLDIVNPQSFREFVVEEFERSRLALWSAKVGHSIGTSSYLEGVLIPDLSFAELPEEGAAFTLNQQSGQRAGQQWPGRRTERPELSVANLELGLRWQSNIGSTEVSVLGFRHFIDLPQPVLLIVDGKSIVELRYLKTVTLGVEGSHPVGDSLLRLEAAYDDRVPLNQPLSENEFSSMRANRISLLVGIDRPVRDAGLLSLQYSVRKIHVQEGSADTPESQQLATFLWRDQLLVNKLTASVFVTVDIEAHDTLIRPRLHWSLSDTHQLELGLDQFTGAREGLFGQFRDSSRWYVEWTWTP